MNTVQTAHSPNTSPDLTMLLERRTSDGVEYDDATDADEEWKPARGFLNGILIATPLWGLIGMLIWLVLG
jgi:hypothetical protein